MATFVHATVDLGTNVTLGENTKVWHYAQVRENAILGEGCVIGRGAYVGTGVSLGKNCKVQNYALVYEPAVLGNGVFIGPAAVLTNDQFPRSVSPNLDLKGGEDWEAVGVTIEDGASIGARACAHTHSHTRNRHPARRASRAPLLDLRNHCACGHL